MTMTGSLLTACSTIGLTCSLMLRLELCFLVGFILQTKGRPNPAIKTLNHPQEADTSDYTSLFSKVEILSKHSKLFKEETLHSSSISRSSEVKDFLNKIGYCSKDRFVVTEEQHASSRPMLHSMGSKQTLPLQLDKNVIQLLHQDKLGIDIFESTKPRGLIRRTSDVTSRTVGYIASNVYLAHNIQEGNRGIITKDILNKVGVKSELRSVRSPGQVEDFAQRESITQPKYASMHATITKMNHILNAVNLHYIDTYSDSTKENEHKKDLKNDATIVQRKESSNDLPDHIVGGLLSLRNYPTAMKVLDIGPELSEPVTFQKKKQGRLSSQELVIPSNVVLSKELTVANVTDGVSQPELKIVNQKKSDLEPTKDLTFPARLLDILIRNIDELYSITDSSFTMYHRKYFGSKDVDEIPRRGIPGIEWRQSGLQRWLKPSVQRLQNHTVYLKDFGHLMQGIICYEKRQGDHEKLLSGLKLLNVFLTRVRYKITQLIRRKYYADTIGDMNETTARIYLDLPSSEHESSELKLLHSLLVLRELRIYLNKLVSEIGLLTPKQ